MMPPTTALRMTDVKLKITDPTRPGGIIGA
jgi:hypothetical protein